MKKKFLSSVLFSLLSLYLMTSCSDNNDDLAKSFKQTPFYVMATNGSNGKISPYGIIKMRECHPKFRFIPNRGYRIDSLFVNNSVVNTTKEFTFDKTDEFNTIRVTFCKKRSKSF